MRNNDVVKKGDWKNRNNNNNNENDRMTNGLHRNHDGKVRRQRWNANGNTKLMNELNAMLADRMDIVSVVVRHHHCQCPHANAIPTSASVHRMSVSVIPMNVNDSIDEALNKNIVLESIVRVPDMLLNIMQVPDMLLNVKKVSFDKVAYT